MLSLSVSTDPFDCVPNPLPHQSGCYNPLVQEAVRIAVEYGIAVAAAAGNENIDACKVAPASEKLAYTVAASTKFDSKATYSNHGPCVNIFAPGSGILSSLPFGRQDAWDGTSMATPHVSGVFAVLLSTKSYAKVQDLYDQVTTMATNDTISNVPENTVNRLLYIE